MEDRIADEVLSRFERLPRRSKPAVHGDGIYDWVPMAGIVAVRGNNEFDCLSLATGMKCLPVDLISKAHGLVLHDWHAEILAIRCFNHFLIQECYDLANSSSMTSQYIRRRYVDEISASQTPQPFALQEDVKIHIYCSEVPCGDASMELTMAAQNDPTPWASPASSDRDNASQGGLKGRGYFSELGIVRRKPSRGDSPPTLSKSCSDKLSMKQCTSLLSSPASLLVSPENAYLHDLILPSSQYVPSACQRAFSPEGRMQAVSGKQWSGGYAFKPFEIKQTSREFAFSKRNTGFPNVVPKSSNIATAWNPRMHETLINGVLQGRKQTDPKGASAVCRIRTWKLVLETLTLLALPAFTHILSNSSSSNLEASTLLDSRRRVKREVRKGALNGWVPNERDAFELDSGYDNDVY